MHMMDGAGMSSWTGSTSCWGKDPGLQIVIPCSSCLDKGSSSLYIQVQKAKTRPHQPDQNGIWASVTAFPTPPFKRNLKSVTNGDAVRDSSCWIVKRIRGALRLIPVRSVRRLGPLSVENSLAETMAALALPNPATRIVPLVAHDYKPHIIH